MASLIPLWVSSLIPSTCDSEWVLIYDCVLHSFFCQAALLPSSWNGQPLRERVPHPPFTRKRKEGDQTFYSFLIMTTVSFIWQFVKKLVKHFQLHHMYQSRPHCQLVNLHPWLSNTLLGPDQWVSYEVDHPCTIDPIQMLCCSFHFLCSNHSIWSFLDNDVPIATVIYLQLWRNFRWIRVKTIGLLMKLMFIRPWWQCPCWTRQDSSTLPPSSSANSTIPTKIILSICSTETIVKSFCPLLQMARTFLHRCQTCYSWVNNWV